MLINPQVEKRHIKSVPVYVDPLASRLNVGFHHLILRTPNASESWPVFYISCRISDPNITHGNIR